MRTLFLSLGLATLAAVWLALPNLAPHNFASHMTMHMGVVAVAAPLLSLGVKGTRWDPVIRAPRLFAPVPASMVELLIVWAWHAPAPHHFARHTVPGLVLEQSMFLLSGLLVWLAAMGGPSPRPLERTGAGIAGLLLTSMHMTLLGALLALSPRPLYESHHHSGGLADQHLGGAIMLLVGGASYLLGGLWLTADLLRRRRNLNTAPS